MHFPPRASFPLQNTFCIDFVIRKHLYALALFQFSSTVFWTFALQFSISLYITISAMINKLIKFIPHPIFPSEMLFQAL